VVPECAHPHARAVVAAIARIEIFMAFREEFSNLKLEQDNAGAVSA
jgi:hypothetical protein